MSIELPPALAKLFGVIAGSEWPQANEDGLRQVAELYEDSSADFEELEQLFVQLVGRIGDEFHGDAAQSFVTTVRQYVEGDDFIGKARSGALELAGAARSTANDVEYGKWMIIAQLVQLLAELLFLDATSFINPFAAAEEAAAIAATRIIVRQLIKALIKSIVEHTVMEVAIGAAMDRIIQTIQILQGNRQGYDNSKLVQVVEQGLTTGVANGIMGPGAKKLGDKAGSWLGKQFGDVFSHLPGPSPLGKGGGRGLADDLGNTVDKHISSFGSSFGKGGTKVDDFADDVADSFEKHLGDDLGRDAARDLGHDYATTLANGWGKRDLTGLGDDLNDVLAHSLGKDDAAALAHGVPQAINRGVTGHTIGKEIGEGSVEALQEGLGEYLGGGFYGLIFDPSHSFQSDPGAFGAGVIGSGLSRGGHHLVHSALDLSGLMNHPDLSHTPTVASLLASDGAPRSTGGPSTIGGPTRGPSTTGGHATSGGLVTSGGPATSGGPSATGGHATSGGPVTSGGPPTTTGDHATPDGPAASGGPATSGGPITSGGSATSGGPVTSSGPATSGGPATPPPTASHPVPSDGATVAPPQTRSIDGGTPEPPPSGVPHTGAVAAPTVTHSPDAQQAYAAGPQHAAPQNAAPPTAPPHATAPQPSGPTPTADARPPAQPTAVPAPVPGATQGAATATPSAAPSTANPTPGPTPGPTPRPTTTPASEPTTTSAATPAARPTTSTAPPATTSGTTAGGTSFGGRPTTSSAPASAPTAGNTQAPAARPATATSTPTTSTPTTSTTTTSTPTTSTPSGGTGPDGGPRRDDPPRSDDPPDDDPPSDDDYGTGALFGDPGSPHPDTISQHSDTDGHDDTDSHDDTDGHSDDGYGTGGLFDEPGDHHPDTTPQADTTPHPDTTPQPGPHAAHGEPRPSTGPEPTDTGDTHPVNTDGNFFPEAYTAGDSNHPAGGFLGRVDPPTVPPRLRPTDTQPDHPQYPQRYGHARDLAFREHPDAPVPTTARTNHHLYPANRIVEDLHTAVNHRSDEGWNELERIAAVTYPDLAHGPDSALTRLLDGTFHEDPATVRQWFTSGLTEGPDQRLARILGTLGTHAQWAPHNVFEGVSTTLRAGDPGSGRDRHYTGGPGGHVESAQSQVAGVIDAAGGMHRVATPQEVPPHIHEQALRLSGPDLRQRFAESTPDTRPFWARELIDQLHRSHPGSTGRPETDWSRWAPETLPNGRQGWRHDGTTGPSAPPPVATVSSHPGNGTESSASDDSFHTAQTGPDDGTESSASDDSFHTAQTGPDEHPHGGPGPRRDDDPDAGAGTTFAPAPTHPSPSHPSPSHSEPSHSEPSHPDPSHSEPSHSEPQSHPGPTRSTPGQREQLGRHGARPLPSRGATPAESLAHAVQDSLDNDATFHGHRADPDGHTDPDAAAAAAGVRLHVLHPDGSFTAHGPVTGVPVHVVRTGDGDSARYSGIADDVQIGRDGVSYPGPARDTGKQGAAPLHRGEFEVETVGGRHHVRMYTAVVHPADISGPAATHKDVHQDPATGEVQIGSGRNRVLWSGAGRPMRAAQWLSKYEQTMPGKQPALRSFLVPLHTYDAITRSAVVEGHLQPDGSAPSSEPPVYNVDQSGDANQFGVGGDHLDELTRQAVPGSLITYRSDPAGADPTWDGRALPVSRLYERLGIDPDFRHGVEGSSDDPWFQANPRSGNVTFRNNPRALDQIAGRMDTHLRTWDDQTAGRPVDPAAVTALRDLRTRLGSDGADDPAVRRRIEHLGAQARIGALLAADAAAIRQDPDVRPHHDPDGPYPNDYAAWRSAGPPARHHTDAAGLSVLDLSGTRAVGGPADVGQVTVRGPGGDDVPRPAPWKQRAPVVVVLGPSAAGKPAATAERIRTHLADAGVPPGRPVLLVAADGAPLSGGLDHVVADATGRTVWASTRPTHVAPAAGGAPRIGTDGAVTGPGQLGSWVSMTPSGVRTTPVLTADGAPVGTHILPASHTPSRLLGDDVARAGGYVSHGGDAPRTEPLPGGAPAGVPRIVVAVHADGDGFHLTTGHEGTRTVDGATLAAELGDVLPEHGPYDVQLIACDAATTPAAGGRLSPAQQFANALGGRGLRSVIAATGTVDLPRGTEGATIHVHPDPQGRPGQFVTVRPDPDAATVAATARELGTDGPAALDALRTLNAYADLDGSAATLQAVHRLGTLAGDPSPAALARLAQQALGPSATGHPTTDVPRLVQLATHSDAPPTSAGLTTAALAHAAGDGGPHDPADTAHLTAWHDSAAAHPGGAAARALEHLHDLAGRRRAQGADEAAIRDELAAWSRTLAPQADGTLLPVAQPVATSPAPIGDTTFGPRVDGFGRATTPDERRDLAELAGIAARDHGHRGPFTPSGAHALWSDVTGAASTRSDAEVVRDLRALLHGARAAAGRGRFGLRARPGSADLAAVHRATATPASREAPLATDLDAALAARTLRITDPGALARSVVATAPPVALGDADAREEITRQVTRALADPDTLAAALAPAGRSPVVTVTTADGHRVRLELTPHVDETSAHDLDGAPQPGAPAIKASASVPGGKTAATAGHGRTWKVALPIAPVGPGMVALSAEAGYHFGDVQAKTDSSVKLGAGGSHKDGSTRSAAAADVVVSAHWQVTAPREHPVVVDAGATGQLTWTRTAWTRPDGDTLLPPTLPPGAVPRGAVLTDVGTPRQHALLTDRVLAAAGRRASDPAREQVARQLTATRLRQALLLDPAAPVRVAVGDTTVDVRLSSAEPLTLTAVATKQDLGDTVSATAARSGTRSRVHGPEGALTGGPRVPGLPAGDSVLPSVRLGGSALRTDESASGQDTKTSTALTTSGEAGRYTGTLTATVDGATAGTALDLGAVLGRDAARTAAGWPQLDHQPADEPSPLPAGAPGLGLHRVERILAPDGSDLAPALIERTRRAVHEQHPGLLPDGPNPSRRQRRNAALLEEALRGAALTRGLDRALGGRAPEVRLRAPWWSRGGDVRLQVTARLGDGAVTAHRHGADVAFGREVSASRTGSRSAARTGELQAGVSATVTGGGSGRGTLSASTGVQHARTRGAARAETTVHESTVTLSGRFPLATHDVTLGLRSTRGRDATPRPLFDDLTGTADVLLPGRGLTGADPRPAGPIETADPADLAGVRTGGGGPHAPRGASWTSDPRPFAELADHVTSQVRMPASDVVRTAVREGVTDGLIAPGRRTGALRNLIAPARTLDLLRSRPVRDRTADARHSTQWSDSRPVAVTEGSVSLTDTDRVAWTGSAARTTTALASAGIGGRGTGDSAAGGVVPGARVTRTLADRSSSDTVQVSTASGVSFGSQSLLVSSHDAVVTAAVSSTPLALGVSHGHDAAAASRFVPEAAHSAEPLAHARDDGRADDGLPDRPAPELPRATEIALLQPATGELDATAALTRLRDGLDGDSAAGRALFGDTTGTRTADAQRNDGRDALEDLLSPGGLRAARRRLQTADGVTQVVDGVPVRVRLVATGRTDLGMEAEADVTASREVETSGKAGSSRATALTGTLATTAGDGGGAGQAGGTASAKISDSTASSTTTTATSTTKISVKGPAVRSRVTYDLELTVDHGPAVRAAAGALTEVTPAGVLALDAGAGPVVARTDDRLGDAALLGHDDVAVLQVDGSHELAEQLARTLGTGGRSGLGDAAVGPDTLAAILPAAATGGHHLASADVGALRTTAVQAELRATVDTSRARLVGVLDDTVVSRTRTGSESSDLARGSGSDAGLSATGSGGAPVGEERLGGSGGPPGVSSTASTTRTSGSGSLTVSASSDTRGRAVVLSVPMAWQVTGGATVPGTALVVVGHSRARELGLLDADGTPTLEGTAADLRAVTPRLTAAVRAESTARAHAVTALDRSAREDSDAARTALLDALQGHADALDDLHRAQSELGRALGRPADPAAPPATPDLLDDLPRDARADLAELRGRVHDGMQGLDPRATTTGALGAVTADRPARVRAAWLAADAATRAYAATVTGPDVDPAAVAAARRTARALTSHAEAAAATPADRPLPRPAPLPARPNDARPAPAQPPRAARTDGDVLTAGSRRFHVVERDDPDGDGFFHALAAQLGEDAAPVAELRQDLSDTLALAALDPEHPLHPLLVPDTTQVVDAGGIDGAELSSEQRLELAAAGRISGPVPSATAAAMLGAATATPGSWDTAAADLWPALAARHFGRPVLVVDADGRQLHAIAAPVPHADDVPLVLALRDGQWLVLHPLTPGAGARPGTPEPHTEPLGDLPVAAAPASTPVDAGGLSAAITALLSGTPARRGPGKDGAVDVLPTIVEEDP